MNCGSGTNTRSELLALWSLLYFVGYKKISILLLVGDSKVIIEWFNNVNYLHVISLLPWMRRIRLLSGHCIQLKVEHIYIDYNQEADLLSKVALELEEEGIFYAVGHEEEAEEFERMEIN